MKSLLALSLLALAVSAQAADHRLAYSKAENVEVFVEHAGKVAVACIPARSPITGDGKTKAGWMNLLSHRDSLNYRPSHKCDR